MFQNLLISHPSRPRSRSCCLLQYVHIGFRFLRYQCSPWLAWMIASLKLLFASKEERIRLQLRCFNAITRIDFVSVYELSNDLLW